MAVANLFNVNIDVFSYNINNTKDSWNSIVPDPNMTSQSEFKNRKWVPDMAL